MCWSLSFSFPWWILEEKVALEDKAPTANSVFLGECIFSKSKSSKAFMPC